MPFSLNPMVPNYGVTAFRVEVKLKSYHWIAYPDIPTQAIDILKKLQAISRNYILVFPGGNDPRKPMSEATINKIIKMIGYHGRLAGHRFRHMMSTILHEKGFDSMWFEMQLAHVDKNSIRGTYNHAQYLKQRESMMQAYSDLLIPRY